MTGGGGGGGGMYADYVAGALAGSANIALGFPADTVKVRLQNRLSPYSGAWHCATSIFRYEGFRALYRGMSPQLVGGALETGVNYAAYQAMLSWTQRDTSAGGLGLPAAAAVPLSAATAGCVLSFVLTPAEMVKCRLQLGGTERYHSYSGPLDCLRQTILAPTACCATGCPAKRTSQQAALPPPRSSPPACCQPSPTLGQRWCAAG